MKIARMLLLTALILSPSVSLFPQGRDVPAEVEAARHSLHDAYDSLQHAGGDWGGHRVTAMHHIEETLKELNEAEKWAREHHDMK